jgi:transcription elongation GreA/GreB family factor
MPELLDPSRRPAPVDKAAVLERVRKRSREELDAISEAQRATVTAATHEENKPENDKDTRAIEASYLARGQAARVADLREAVALLSALKVVEQTDDSPVRVGTLVELVETGRCDLCFLVPAGGGSEVEIENVTVRTVSTRSPLGRALLGRKLGDDLEVPTPSGPRELHISGLW